MKKLPSKTRSFDCCAEWNLDMVAEMFYYHHFILTPDRGPGHVIEQNLPQYHVNIYMAQSYCKMGLQSVQIFPNFPSRLFASSDEMAEGMRHLSVNYYEAQEPLRRHVPMHLAEDSTIQETAFVFPSPSFLCSPRHHSSAVPPLVVVGEKGTLRPASPWQLPPQSPFLGPSNRFLSYRD